MTRVYRMVNATTAIEYVRALTILKPKLSEEHLRLFQAHYQCADRTATPNRSALEGTGEAEA